MIRILFFSALCFFLTINSVSANDVKEGLEIGDQAPDFKLNTLDGETLQLSDFRGERVMINFWATWCPPCRQEMPDMERFYQEHDPIIFSVNVTDEELNTQLVKDFMQELKLTFPVLLDKEGEVSNLYRIQAIPMTYMIDAEGIIQFKSFGALSYKQMVKQFAQMEKTE
ncbi:TlpA family protein disulfide reductase [Oceanobacillus neutriphilus]|uniref:Thiol:disulfide interchange protein tlpA n=1 Tax=Oceanobacillus neutriphilus TaxID=531815 RepID=A0ABQ2P2P2_9BACI|nr:TlpA disulfide reductase family protein [Oceanobacillus neutriphilus]GGP16561.1 thiol:disulfide interchange protein tlpA [Oceanobacillus neutriphilus]